MVLSFSIFDAIGIYCKQSASSTHLHRLFLGISHWMPLPHQNRPNLFTSASTSIIYNKNRIQKGKKLKLHRLRMDVLEYHSVEFNHYMSCSFGFLTTTNGFLASLALLTAVVSCWKLRSSLIPPPPPPPTTTTHKPPSQVPPPLETPQPSSDVDKQVPTAAATYSGSSSSLVSSLDGIAEEEEDAEMTKISAASSPRKFTVMYYGEDEPALFEYCRDVVEYVNPAILVLAPSPPSPSLRTIRGNNDLGWYRHQDLSMLNGSVVKLWDCKKQRRNSRISLASSSLSDGIMS